MSDLTITMEATTTRELARRHGLELRGADVSIETMGGVDAHFDVPALSYALSAVWAGKADRSIAAIICSPEVAAEYQGAASVLWSPDRDPEEIFYEIFYDSATERRWKNVPRDISSEATIAPTAHIGEYVVIGPGCIVMPGAVILDNTVLGAGVTIKPNAVVGGDGFQVRKIRGENVVVPHVGGVLIRDGVSVGSQTCIDRGLFGESTTIGESAQVDNLVHVAHAVRIGPESVVVACSEVSGGVQLGRGVWLGPNSAISNGLTLGDYAFVGVSGAVVRDLPDYALAYGNPAKQRGWVCACRTKLALDDSHGEAAVSCNSCGREYRFRGGKVSAA